MGVTSISEQAYVSGTSSSGLWELKDMDSFSVASSFSFLLFSWEERWACPQDTL